MEKFFIYISFGIEALVLTPVISKWSTRTTAKKNQTSPPVYLCYAFALCYWNFSDAHVTQVVYIIP